MAVVLAVTVTAGLTDTLFELAKHLLVVGGNEIVRHSVALHIGGVQTYAGKSYCDSCAASMWANIAARVDYSGSRGDGGE